TEAERGTPLIEIYQHILTPALREVGRMWQRRLINEAEEHYCSQITEALLAMLSANVQPARQKKTVLGFCVEGEHHDIGIRLALDCFALQGWDAVCFGANLPARNIPSTLLN